MAEQQEQASTVPPPGPRSHRRGTSGSCTLRFCIAGGEGLIYEVQWVLCGCPPLSKKEEDSLDALLHLSWDVRAAWMRGGGRVESQRGTDGPLRTFEMWKGWIHAGAE